MVVIRSHDALFRFVFREPEQMGELLRGSLPAALVRAIDWAALRRLDGTFVDAELQERHADLLFETRIGARQLLLYVLVEHKSEADRLTAFQLLRYVVRVHDGWLKEHPDANALPPVLPFVMHHGVAAWAAPRSVRALIDLGGLPKDVARALRAVQPDLRFVLDDLAGATEASVEARRLSRVADLSLRFLQIVRYLPPARALEVIAGWQRALKQLLEHPRGRDVLRALSSWFITGLPAGQPALRELMARIHDPDTRQTMKSAGDELMEEGFSKGLEEGLEKGREEGQLSGQRELLRRQLTARFGALAEPLGARLAAGTAAELETWSVRLLSAGSVDEVFRDA